MSTAVYTPPGPRDTLHVANWGPVPAAEEHAVRAALEAQDHRILDAGYVEAIRLCEAAVIEALRGYANPAAADALDLRRLIQATLTFLDRRRSYISRRVALAELAAEEAPPAEPGDVAVLDAILGRLAYYRGHAREVLDAARTDLAARLERHEARLDDALNAYKSGNNFIPSLVPYGPGLDVFLAGPVAALAVKTGRLRDRLALLQSDAIAVERFRGERAAELVQEVGGADNLARSIRAARIVTGQWTEASENHRDLVAARSELARAQEGLEAAKASGLAVLADEGKARFDAAKKAVSDLEKSIDRDLRGAVDAGIERLLSGDNAERTALAGLARSTPSAFPTSFAERLDEIANQAASPTALLIQVARWDAEDRKAE